MLPVFQRHQKQPRRGAPAVAIIVAAMALALFAANGTAWAHAHLIGAEPAQGAQLAERPAEVTLTFDERIELRFSTFKVYPLDAEGDEQALREAARALVSQVLAARDDEAQRADTGLANSEARSEMVAIGLKEDLAPGTYVVMWRVLSADTHVVEGFYTFTYNPGG